MKIKLPKNPTFAKRWVKTGVFSVKMEFLCGSCGKHNPKRGACVDSSGVVWEPCDFCGESNFFRTSKRTVLAVE